MLQLQVAQKTTPSLTISMLSDPPGAIDIKCSGQYPPSHGGVCGLLPLLSSVSAEAEV